MICVSEIDAFITLFMLFNGKFQRQGKRNTENGVFGCRHYKRSEKP
jgi:hypothetical protein